MPLLFRWQICWETIFASTKKGNRGSSMILRLWIYIFWPNRTSLWTENGVFRIAMSTCTAARTWLKEKFFLKLHAFWSGVKAFQKFDFHPNFVAIFGAFPAIDADVLFFLSSFCTEGSFLQRVQQMSSRIYRRFPGAMTHRSKT